MSTRLVEPQASNIAPGSARCASCGSSLGSLYYFLPGRDDRYCPRCILSRPRCDSCSAPVGDDGWRLHDGRTLCSECHQVAVYDSSEANRIFETVVEQVADHPGLSLRIGVAFRLVDQPTLIRLATEGGVVPADSEHTLGLYHRNGRLRVVYALYALPRLLLRTVVAHELAHAWQGENAPLLQDPLWREGFAEWVAYRHLRHIGAAKAAERMLKAEHPYRPGLERCLGVEQRLGIAGVLDHIRSVE